MAKYSLDRDEAEKQMRNTDMSRAQHYKRFTGRQYGKQEYYHLGVDTSQLGIGNSVELIIDAIRMWCDVRGTHPLSTL